MLRQNNNDRFYISDFIYPKSSFNSDIVIKSGGTQKIKLGQDGRIEASNICFGNQCMASHRHSYDPKNSSSDKYWTGRPGVNEHADTIIK